MRQPELHVANLPPGLTQEDLAEVFADYGLVIRTSIRQGGGGKTFGFVIMQTEEQAQDAMADLNNAVLNGFTISVVPSRSQEGQPVSQASQDIHVAGLSLKTTEKQLSQLFAMCGPVVAIRLKPRPDQSGSYAFIRMGNDEATTRAIQQLDGFLLNDQPMSLQMAKHNPHERANTPTSPLSLTTQQPLNRPLTDQDVVTLRQIEGMVNVVGIDTSIRMMQEALKYHLQGGYTTEDGFHFNTLTGIFYQLAYEYLPERIHSQIFPDANPETPTTINDSTGKETAPLAR